MISFPRTNPYLFKILNDPSPLHFKLYLVFLLCLRLNMQWIYLYLYTKTTSGWFPHFAQCVVTQMLIVLSLLVLDSDLWPVKMIRGRHPSHLRYHSIGLHCTLVCTAKIPSGDNLLAPFTFSHTYIHCCVALRFLSYLWYVFQFLT